MAMVKMAVDVVRSAGANQAAEMTVPGPTRARLENPTVKTKVGFIEWYNLKASSV